MRKFILYFTFAFALLGLAGAQVVSDSPFLGGRSGTASFVNYGSSFTSYYGGQASTYWPILSNRDECVANQDIIIQVTPAGCQPAVVRSDLLAEQNVPVFCQLDLLQLNPAVNVKQIRNIRFSGKYPEYVAGVGFHPARAALRTTNQLLGSPLESNIGYVVVVLKRNPDEKKMPDFFNFTLTAGIDYYSGNAVGIGTTEMLLRETTDNEWEVAKNKQTFFGGKMSVRVKDVDTDSMRVEIYSGDIKYSEVTMQKNKPQSNAVYLPGSYCQTSLQLSYSDFVSPSNIARIKVDDDMLDVYEGSRFLNGKCTVRQIKGDYSSGSVDIICGRENIKLGSSVQPLKADDGVYLLKSNFEADESNKYKIVGVIRNETGVFYNITAGDNSFQVVAFDKVRAVNLNEINDASYGEHEQYILNATNYYEQIADSYGNEKKDGLADSYGETALSAAISLSDTWGKKNNAIRLINKYLEIYPDGKNSAEFRRMLNNIYSSRGSLSGQSVETEDGIHLIKLIEVTGVGRKSSAKISWGNTDKVMNQGETFNFGHGDLTLVSVRDSENVEVNAVCKSSGSNPETHTEVIGIRDSKPKTPCGPVLKVSNIDWQRYVKLTISPVTRSGSIGNFTVGVGIEKRAIELTPDRANKRIKNLNESIKKWESISKNLGEMVKGMKAACFATTGVLIVKNFISGLDGESLARREAMTGDDGWTKICQDKVNNKEPGALTLTACYNKYSSDIKKDVEARVNAIKETNKVTSGIEKANKYPNREGFFAGESFDDVKARKDLIERIRSDCKDINFDNRNVLSLLPAQTATNEDAKRYSYSQLRDIYFNCQTIKNDGSVQGKKKAETDLSVIGKSVDERLKYERDVNQYKGVGLYTLDVGGRGKYSGETTETLKKSGFTNLPSGDVPVQVVRGRDKTYLITLEKTAEGYLRKDIYSLDGTNVGNKINISTSTGVGGSQTDLSGLPNIFDLVNSGSYNNQFAPGETTVRYFETEPYKGMPAVVPFDLTRGFYAATTQSLPLLGKTKSYESNGRPSSFFVCNVMKDGRVGFYAPNYGDDECVQFNMYTGQPFTNFPGLTETDTKKLVSDAIKALEEAAKQYGKKDVKINGIRLNVGSAASLLPGSQCQDYMSPTDCKILFNVCDPVICPSSRCNLGGQYYVSDVIQSGIVGSALLCLPNVQEGIYIPVCLTGLKAGIDGYVSILKSHQACLQEAVETGKYVGICDQVSSVYMCEFFWRQAAPIAKVAIPKMVEYVYTGGQKNVRGGGEYLTVQNSWQNVEDSASYFTQSYAANSFEAFRIRNVAEAGTEFCRAFISAKGPKTFETLIEPDSPPQFHAWFSSIDYTDATVPATSQYKVFYHIFAGNDRGVSFSVYLKDPPSDIQYSSNPVVIVANGFVSRGQYATESKDFTAPKGYQQLCVRFNDREECGFKQVSSSFAVDYVKDSVVAEQLKQADVKTEKECVSGSISPAALLNPNLQSIGEEALDPAIYNRGIVRVCSTSNPGSATDPTRFVKVGVCGSERLGCWLDKQSVDKSITAANTNLKDKTLSEIERIQNNTFNEKNDFKSSDVIGNDLRVLEGDIGNREKLPGLLKALDELMIKAFWNYDKAEILFWKAKAYEEVFEVLRAEVAKNVKGSAANAGASTAAPAASGGSGSTSDAGTSGGSGAKVLSFGNENYEENTRTYLYLNGAKTKIYFIKNKVRLGANFENEVGAIALGDVVNGGIVFGTSTNPLKMRLINDVLGPGSYDLINNKVTIENIKQGIDLNSLVGIVSGAATVP